jgi:hypothetical protein
MNDDNAWIDEIIFKHKKINQSSNDKSNDYYSFLSNNSGFQNNNNSKYQSDFTNSINLNNYLKYNEVQLNNKLIQKKEKIKKLKLENSYLNQQNELLKNNLKNLEENNNNENIEKLKNIIENLECKIENLETERKELIDKIKELENLKNNDINLMNEKIKDFEILIDDNSKNYFKDLNLLRKQSEEYRNKIEESHKYVEIVNNFITKINSLFGNQKKEEIYEFDKLQNKFIEIESYISKLINLTKLEKENNENNIKIPNFQNKILEEGINYKRNNSSISFTVNNTDKYYKELDNKSEEKSIDKAIKYRVKKNNLKRNKSVGRTNYKKINSSNQSIVVNNSKNKGKPKLQKKKI